MDTNEKKRLGFAAMDPDKQRELASSGGRAAHAKGTAHKWTPEQAKEYGRLGGLKISQDREHMSRIGRLAHKRPEPVPAP